MAGAIAGEGTKLYRWAVATKGSKGSPWDGTAWVSGGTEEKGADGSIGSGSGKHGGGEKTGEEKRENGASQEKMGLDKLGESRRTK